jgi:acetoin utilization deacetylase AcuC-like enzyme
MQFHQSTHCKRRTAWVSSELYYWHDTQTWCGYLEPSLTVQPGQHFENAETKRRFQGLVEATALDRHLLSVRPHAATDEVLQLIHAADYIRELEALCHAGGGEAGSSTPVGRASVDIARLAAGGVIAAVDAVFTGDADNAYVLCRPPGHHALADQALGFCLFANLAIGVAWAQQRYGIKRVATIDWDVHHGNGTEAAFYASADVLTISLHQQRLFPETTGDASDTGHGAGEGFNLNIPLPAGSGSGAYRQAFEQLAMPALESFAPEAIFIASGFDALGRQMLCADDYRWMTGQLLTVADRHCKGRIIATHEGGYSATYVPYCGIAVLEALAGTSASLEDPFHDSVTGYGGQALSAEQQRVIDDIARQTNSNSR